MWVYADIGQDDSYTPHKLSIRAGTYHGDLHEVRWVELGQPKGWQVVRLSASVRPGEEPSELKECVLSLPALSRARTDPPPPSRTAATRCAPTCSRSPSSRTT